MTRGPVGAHAYWTKPDPERAEALLTGVDGAVLVASAIAWRASNGPVWLFTDRRGLEIVGRLGLAGLWDHIDTACLESIPDDICASVFWDLGKAVALGCLPPGGCVLDLDLIVWTRLEPTEPGAVSFLHWEAPVPPWYASASELCTPPGYTFDPTIDWDAPACNTAFMSCGDPSVRRSYVREALAFARNNRGRRARAAEVLFCAQRLFSHTIRASGAQAQPLIEYLYVPLGTSRWLVDDAMTDDPLTPTACENGVPFTHLWRDKHALRDQHDAAAAFCDLLVRRCRDRAGTTVERWLPMLNPFG